MPDSFALVRPLLLRLPPETAHGLTIRSLKMGLGPRAVGADDPILKVRVWGRELSNPIGLAAGFDKDAEVPDAMLRLGFGFVEVGSITPQPQPGNPMPRIFRLPRQQALINRLGFNSKGLDHAVEQLRRRLEAERRAPGLVGANLGVNKGSADPAADYRRGIAALARLVDYVVINVSSPNTPGLRALQGREPLQRLLDAVVLARGSGDPPLPILLKIAPDLTDEDREDVAAVALDSAIDGMIVTNTTIARPPGMPAWAAHEPGGLSGPPLMPLATQTLRTMAQLTGGRLPLIGVGGIAGAADAYAKIRAGATLVQLYTALIYQGPGLVARIKRELAALLRADGFDSLAAAVGSDRGSQERIA